MRVAAIFVFFLSSAAQMAGSGINLYSLKKEISLGRQMSLEVEKQARLLDDPTITEYVNRIGQRVAGEADSSFPIVIRVIQASEVNAFTLPGGHIFVNTGMLRVTESEAELASLLAHEVGHVVGRHLTREASKSQLLKAGLVPVSSVTGISGIVARQLAALGLPLGASHFSREFETEADQLGVRYLFNAGYDPNAAVDLLERIETSEQRRPGAVSRFYESHPMTADRIAHVTKSISRLSAGAEPLALNTSEYEEVRKRLANYP
jgi:predicted Zn-dependent protease